MEKPEPVLIQLRLWAFRKRPPMFAWADQSEKLRNGEINKEQYDRWRYTFPAEDTTQRWAKVPSQELSDLLIAVLKEEKD